MVNERLRRARTSRGDDLAELATRIGIREGVLRAIEDGRFDLLPPGIYARAAIRTYSAAVGLDPAEILDECAAALPPVEEPISAMGRLRGIRPAAVEAPVATRGTVAPPSPSARPDWRLAAASAVDAAVVGALLLAVIAIARLVTAAPVATLGTSGALAFAVMGEILALTYFAWFGVSGATAGTRVLGIGRASHGRTPMRLPSLSRRALRCATDDLRFVTEAGLWLGSAVRPREQDDAGPGCRATVLND